MDYKGDNSVENDSFPAHGLVVVIHCLRPSLVLQDKHHAHQRFVHRLKVAHIRPPIVNVHYFGDGVKSHFEGKKTLANERRNEDDAEEEDEEEFHRIDCFSKYPQYVFLVGEPIFRKVQNFDDPVEFNASQQDMDFTWGHERALRCDQGVGYVPYTQQ